METAASSVNMFKCFLYNLSNIILEQIQAMGKVIKSIGADCVFLK